MSQSVALPASPISPEPITPPTLTTPIAQGPETPKALLKRSKEVAKAVKQFIRENRSMQLTIEGKKYPKAEVWQFAAACFGVTAMVASTQELLNEKQEEIGYIAIAHALNSAGRVISGAESTCMCDEPEWKHAPSFKIRSMAQTRSCSKVHRNLFAYVMVLAGLCPTPAEEMGPQGEKREREITTPCYECGNKVTKKRSLETRRKYGKELCLECTKKADDQANGMNTIADPRQVAEHIAKVKRRKANGAQPIVAVMDAEREELPA